MQRLIRKDCGPAAFSVALFVCLLVCLNASTSFAAQRRKSARKAPRPKPTRTEVRAPVAETREPELQLERLPPDPAVEDADIAITAHVKARSLIFEAVPNPTVEFSGQPARDTVWEAQRENLPTPVQPGVTYRNIGIRLKITSVFRDIDRIVAEALGEVPVTDDKTVAAEAAKKSSTPQAETPGSQPAPSRPRLKTPR